MTTEPEPDDLTAAAAFMLELVDQYYGTDHEFDIPEEAEFRYHRAVIEEAAVMTPTRPDPHALWQQANGDRDEYLRLLREHGHVIVGTRPDGEDIFGHPATERHEWHEWTPDYGPVERLPDVRPSPDHPIWTLDVRTLDYVIESLVGIWATQPDLLIESAITDVREIRKYAASEPTAMAAAADRMGEALG